MAQQVVRGAYAQVAGLFAHGRLVAVHTSRQVGAGAGGSAAARESTHDPHAYEDIERLGAALDWHGGLTLDYIEDRGRRAYIECNPRTVEPGNAAASGVNLSDLQIALSLGRPIAAAPRVGSRGIRTHGTLALALGAAERTGRRVSILKAIARAAGSRGSREVLTPLRADPPSLIPLVFAVGRVLAQPSSATTLAASAVTAYSVGSGAITTAKAASTAVGRPTD